MKSKNGQPEYLQPSLTLALLPAWQAGVKDSINPGAMTGLLVCGVLLCLILKKGWLFKLTVIPFVVGIAVMAMGSILGVLGVISNTKGMDIFHDVVYFVLASGAILVGLILARDWWTVKRSGEPSRIVIKLDVAQKAKKSQRSLLKNVGRRVVFVVAFLAGGVFMGVVESAWAPDVHSAFMLRDLMLEGWTFSVVMAFFCYGVGTVFPLVILGVSAFAALKMGFLKKMIRDRLSVVQVVLAGFLLSYGFTVIFRYYL